MLTSILLCATVAVQPRTVTFVHPCAHSSVVLAALGEELGMRMEPSGSVNKDYFLLRFDDVPVQDALEKIAETLNATWSVKSGVRYLGRTRAQELAEEQEGLAAMVRGIKKFLAENTVEGEYTPEIARQLITRSVEMQMAGSSPDNVRQLWSFMESTSPGARYLMRVLASLDPETLARLDEERVVRYSPNPEGGQRSLPSGGVRAYEQFLQETAIHREAIESTGAFEQLPKAHMYSSLVDPFRPDGASHDAVLVEFQRYRERLGVRIRLPGDFFLTRIAFVVIQADDITTPPDPALTALEAQHEVSPLVQKASDIMLSWFSGSPDGLLAEVPPEVREVFSTPTKNDPLAVLASDWILQSALELDVDVVALLPDSAALVEVRALQEGAVTLGQVWSSKAVLDLELRSSVSDDWLTVAPTYRFLTRKERVSRAAIERFIESYEKIGRKSLDAVADLVGSTESEPPLQLSLTLSAIGLGEPSILAGFLGFLDALRLYSRLSPSERKAAREGGHRIPIDSLKGDSAKYATRMMFGRMGFIEESRAEISPTTEFAWRRAPVGATYAQDVLAGGVPPGSLINVYVVSHQAVFPKQMAAGSAYQQQGLTTAMLANQIAGSEYIGWPAPDPSLLAQVEVEQVVMEFVFPGHGYSYTWASVDHLGRDTKYVPLSEMDPAWSQDFEEKLLQYRKMYSERAAVPGQRKNPPPSR